MSDSWNGTDRKTYVSERNHRLQKKNISKEFPEEYAAMTEKLVEAFEKSFVD